MLHAIIVEGQSIAKGNLPIKLRSRLKFRGFQQKISTTFYDIEETR
jgi:hypothetical protein